MAHELNHINPQGRWVLIGYNFFFLTSQLLLRMKHAISTRWLANINRGCVCFSHSFWSSYEYLIHYQSENLCAH